MIKWRASYCFGLFAVLLATLTLAPDSRIASAATCPPAGTIAFGEAIQCSISVAGEQDAFTFSAQGGDRVHLRLVDLSAGPLAPAFDLAGTGGSICSGNGASFIEADCILTGAGIKSYSITTSDLNGTATGGYALYIQDVDAPAGPIGMAYGDTVTSIVTAAPAADVHVFSGTGGDRVLVRVADLTNGPLQPEVRLYGPAGLICAANDPALAQVNCILSGVGTNTYTVLTADVLGISTGNLGMHVQRTRDAANATSITSGQTISGHLTSVPQMDAYTFRAIAGTSATLTAINPAGGSLQPEILLYGFGLICSANGNPAQTTCLLPGTGSNTYTVLVADFLGKSTGYYCLALDVLAPACADADGDTIPDDFDNCPDAANTNQLNTDADNLTKHRPGADAIGDACDDDIDGDGYSNVKETTPPLAESPLTYCNIMRADVDGDGAVSILDFGTVSPQFIQHIPPALPRYDQDGDSTIGILDYANMSNAFLKHARDCP